MIVFGGEVFGGGGEEIGLDEVMGDPMMMKFVFLYSFGVLVSHFSQFNQFSRSIMSDSL